MLCFTSYLIFLSPYLKNVLKIQNTNKLNLFKKYKTKLLNDNNNDKIAAYLAEYTTDKSLKWKRNRKRDEGVVERRRK